MGAATGTPTVVAVRALVPDSTAGADYHRQSTGHWITDSKIANPMSAWEEYRASRTSWGLGALGTFVVEVETSDGHIGVAPSIGGPPAAFLVERHLARFAEGAPLTVAGISETWDQMFRASQYYGRRGLGINAISAIDLALWDALGRSRGEPVWQLLGGHVLDELRFYATGPRPDIARQLGFVGGKLPLPAGPAEGAAGMAENLALAAEMRSRCGDRDQDIDEFFLAFDCYMSLDLPFAVELASRLEPYRFRWIEECLMPDDYWGYAALRRAVPPGLSSTTGEHESTRWGFQLLIEMECADILQPDVGWCGGLTELLRIAELADTAGVPVVPHGSSVYSYHFLVSRPTTPFAEFLMMHPDASEVVPMFAPLLVDEPVPIGGRMRVPDRAGFGVELNRDLPLDRPYVH
ncbi:MAG TPA: L-rhamnonate dehydratase [Ilumatobacter sp.]|nr:L-rhamnonate dehydratase [Ilumatobacter sp.]